MTNTQINEILSTIKSNIDSTEYPNYHKLPYELITNKEFVLKVLKLETSAKCFLTGSIYKELIPLFGYGSNPKLDNLRIDPDIINEAVKIPFNLKYIPENYVTLDIAKGFADSSSFLELPKKYQNTPEIFDMFVNYIKKYKNIGVLLWPSCDEDILNKAFIDLVKANFDFKTDANIRFDLVEIIPKLNKEATKYLFKISPFYIRKSKFKDDEEIVLEAIKIDGSSFECAGKKLRSDKNFALKALKVDVNSRFGLSEELWQDPDISDLIKKLKDTSSSNDYGWY